MRFSSAATSDAPNYIDGVASQLRPGGWLAELNYEGEWDKDSHFILDGIIHGFHVVDKNACIAPYHNFNYRSATCPENRQNLQNLLIDEMSCGKITFANATPTCVHSLGAIVKPNGSLRPITDCKRPIGKSVNSHMTTTFSTFKYKSCDDAMSLMSPGCWMACMNLQSAYRSVAIHPDDRTYCGLSWDFGDGPIHLEDNFISFGQRSAPFIFNRLTDFVTRKMISRGYN